MHNISKALIGEFSPAYEAFREAMIADLAPVTKYDYLQALQLAYLNWVILQVKALRDWCAFNRDENPNSRNELKWQLKGKVA